MYLDTLQDRVADKHRVCKIWDLYMLHFKIYLVSVKSSRDSDASHISLNIKMILSEEVRFSCCVLSV